MLKIIFLLMFWICFLPFLEAFLTPLTCTTPDQNIIGGLICFNGVHIFFMIFSIVFIILYLLICVIIGIFFNETNPTQENTFSRLETTFELVFLGIRVVLLPINIFWKNLIGIWILTILTLLFSILLCIQFFRGLIFFNTFVSVFSGSLNFILGWVALNGIIVLIFGLQGNIIVICIGIPIIIILVKNLRERRVDGLIMTTNEKFKRDSDILIQIHTIQKLIKGPLSSQADEITLTGIVNVHSLECQSNDCPCKKEIELYDVSSDKFSVRNLPYHKDKIFLNHFNKRLYEDALSKFINSVSLNLSFSYFLFEHIKNLHSALIELTNAEKKKPSLQQQFAIFRYKCMIENFVKVETSNSKDVYFQLPNVIDFENLLSECQKSIEKVCNFQIEFWTQLTNVMPDLNILNDLRKKIFNATKEADKLWNQLCKINPNYSKALNLYGSYLNDIKNNQQVGHELLEKAKTKSGKKSIDEIVKSSDILFAEDTAVLHVSGNKDSPGRILKTNQGFTKIFQYNKSEAIGHFVNILMPTLFANKHKDFLETYFKTGKTKTINKEKLLFALHRNGYCFPIKLMVKQIPNLTEGIQYVGMIRQFQSDHQYIITDTKGVIDSFSEGISNILQLSSAFFKDNQINIQVIAPELMKVFDDIEKKRGISEKFKESGGQKLTFIVPRDFASLSQVENKKLTKDGKSKHDKSLDASKDNRNPIFKDFNKALNKSNGIAKQFSIKKIMQTPEYQNYEVKQTVKCEINDLEFGSVKETEPLKIKIFKISGEAHKGYNEGDEEYVSDEGKGALKNEEESIKSGEGRERMSKEETKDDKLKKEKSQLYQLVLQSKAKPDNEGPKIPSSIPSQERSGIDDSNPTDRINVPISSDGRVETKEAQKFPEMSGKYVTNIVTGVVNKIVSQEEVKKEEKISKEGKKEQQLLDLDEDTPRMKLVEMNIPDNSPLIASSRAQPEVVKDQEQSQKSTGKANVRDKLNISSSSNNQSKNSVDNPILLDSKEKESIMNKKNSIEDSDSMILKSQKESSNKQPKISSKKINGENKELKLENQNEDLKISKKEKASDNKDNIFLQDKDNNNSMEAQEDKGNSISKNDESEDQSKSENSNSDIEGQRKSQTKNITDQSIPSADVTKRTSRQMQKPKEAKETSIKKSYEGKKKYPSRIITNPLNSGGAIDLSEYQEYQPSESEKILRKNLLAFGRKLKRDESKKKSELQEEDKKEEDNEEDNEENVSRKGEEEENQDTQSSVTSGSTGSTVRSYYSLRTAIDEKYIPNSLKNLSIAAYIVFLILLALAIVFFSLQYTLFNSINQSIQNIYLSEKRIDYLIDINLQVRTLMIINLDANSHKYIDTTIDITSLFHDTQKNLKNAANQLKDAQTNLSLATASLDSKVLLKINPQSVILFYKSTGNMPTSYNYTIWQAIMEIVVCSYRITTMPNTTISTDDATVYFVTVNSVNSVIIALRNSTNEIINLADDLIYSNLRIFLYLLIAASAILVISQLFLFPIISKVNRNKEEVLILFMSIKKGDVEMMQRKCRQFFQQFHSSNETEFINPDDNLEKNAEGKEGKEGKEAKEEDDDESSDKNKDMANLKKNLAQGKEQRSRHSKKFKKLSSDMGFIIIRFVLMILIIEGYFLMIYFLTSSFFNSISSLTTELSLLIERQPIHSYLLLIVKELILNNGGTNIEYLDSISFTNDYLNRLYNSEEDVLNVNSANEGIHTDLFNTQFKKIYYTNTCPIIFDNQVEITLCESFNQGILQKGIYSSVIKYWDILMQLKTDYLNSKREVADQQTYLKDTRLTIEDQMQSEYFNISLNLLVNLLESDINTRFSNQMNTFKIVFIIYIVYLIAVYFFIWRTFITHIQSELWKAKSVLTILPPELIMLIPSIKEFILNNSSTVFFSKRAD